MSAIFGRILLSIGAGVVAAVVYAILNKREQHAHENAIRQGLRASRRGVEYRTSPAWEDDPYDENLVRKRKPSSRSGSRTSKSNDTAHSEHDEESKCSLQKDCPVCLELFIDLKRKGVVIYSTPCGHLFCYQCLDQALKIDHSPCPTCRKHTLITSCHPIYL